MSNQDAISRPASPSQKALLKAHATLDVGAPVATDGYQPRAAVLLYLNSLRGYPSPEIVRLLLTAQRRCDTAHRQFTRVREQLDTWQSAPGTLQDAVFLIGDAELAVVALEGSLACLEQVRSKLSPPAGHWPKDIQRRRDAVTQLRDAYIHIDARAIGCIKHDTNPDLALSIFLYESLIKKRTLTYGQWRLGVDQEATNLLVATAKYIQNLWDRAIGESR